MFTFDFAWDIQHSLNQIWGVVQFALIVLLLINAYLSFKKPVLGVALTIICLPTYLLRSKFYFLPFTFLEICIWLNFVGFYAGLIKTYQFRLRNILPYRAEIFLILIGSTLALLISPALGAAAGIWKAYFIEPIMFFTVLRPLWQKDKNKKIILWALGLSTIGISVLAIYQKFTGFGIYEPSWTGPENRRVTSIFSSPNAVGLFLAPITIIYIGWIIKKFKSYQENIFKLLIVLLSLAAIIFTNSQGTLLGLAAAIGFILFFGWNKKIIGALAVAAIVISFLLPITREKIIPVITLQDKSGQNRIELWSLGAYSIAQNPVLGNGIYGFAKIQNENRDPEQIEPLLYPHNIVLNFWSEIGLIGLLGFSLLIINFFRNGFRQKDIFRIAVMAAMAGLLVHGLIDVPYFKNDLAVLFWILISLI